MSNKRKSSNPVPPVDLLDDFGTIAIAARHVDVPDSTIRSWIGNPETSARISCRDWHGVLVLRLADVRAVAEDRPKVGRRKMARG